jgi:hypothetical protein
MLLTLRRMQKGVSNSQRRNYTRPYLPDGLWFVKHCLAQYEDGVEDAVFSDPAHLMLRIFKHFLIQKFVTQW